MIFIAGNVPSSKNSKIQTSRGSFLSKTVKKYLRSHGIQSYRVNSTKKAKKGVKGYKTIPMTFPEDELREMFTGKEFPVTVAFHLVRGTRHKFDFHNIVQILADLITAFDIIPDDNMDYFIPEVMYRNDKAYSYDKLNPGVHITIRKK